MRQYLTVPLGFGLIALNTVVHVPVLFAVAALKLLPITAWRRRCSRALMAIAESWIARNSALFPLLTDTRWQVELPEGLSPQGRYLVVCNHRSWVDIPVLQHVFNRRIPLLRFFLKRQLAWVPLLGQAWWALDFPFMHRHSREALARRPELRGQDREATRRACRRLDGLPVSIMNFVEGTRFTAAKRATQDGPHADLLRPRAGGVGFVFEAMGGALDGVVDVTLAYDPPQPSLAALLANRVRTIRVHARLLPVPPEIAAGEGSDEAGFRTRVQAWVDGLWADKQRRFEALRDAPAVDAVVDPPPPAP